MLMRKVKLWWGCVLIGVLISGIVGCSNFNNSGNEDAISTSNQQKNGQSQKKDEDTEEKQANGEILVYNRCDNIVLDVDVDFEALGVEYFDDAVELYQNKELSDKIYCKFNWDKEQHTLSLLPPNLPILNISTAFASKALQREFDHSDYYFFYKGTNKDWGNLGKMYLVKWMDLQTGEKLEQPEITEVHIKGELDTPKNFQFGISEYGNGTLSWKPVEGAGRYLVVEAIYRTDDIRGFFESCNIIAETTDTNWQSETENDYMNTEFNMYDVVSSEKQEYYLGVIAIGEEGTSMISSMIPKDEMAERLPRCKEENRDESEYYSVRYANSIDLLSRYQWIQLCDGTMTQRMIHYQIDEAEIVNITDWENEAKEMLQLPYTIEGTEFDGSVYVESFERNTYLNDLENLQERQDILKSKMSGMLTDVQITVKPEVAASKDSDEIADTDKNEDKEKQGISNSLKEFVSNPIATTELSSYLASCLMQGKEYISVSEVQKGLNEEVLTDAFYEAYFQNPLIPAVKELTISQSGEELLVTYEEASAEREKKQKEIVKQVEFVAGELVEGGMSDVDKVLVINSYLCDNVTYDEKAAERSADGERTFTDSMTPYGALIYHKGVCLAYAGAFQLLAKAMGLDSIVVTGSLNGIQNHAWNKVKLNGKWCVVDVTSNDGQDMKNVFLNVSEQMAGMMLKEDNRYLCDKSIGQYSAQTEEFEYYHLAGRYYEMSMIAEAFVRELSLEKKAVLRTEPTLTNEEFQEIVREVMDNMDQVEMQGYYQMGVIYLEKKDK